MKLSYFENMTSGVGISTIYLKNNDLTEVRVGIVLTYSSNDSTPPQRLRRSGSTARTALRTSSTSPCGPQTVTKTPDGRQPVLLPSAPPARSTTLLCSAASAAQA